MRLIDADALIRRELSRADKFYEDGSINREALQTSMAWEVKAMIDNSPTVDAEPTVHARWKGPEEPPYIKGVVCTNCGKPTIVTGNYCPNCGAKMDLSIKEDR